MQNGVMEEEMKEMAKRTAAAAFVGVVSLSMLAGCSEKKLDGTATVATVDGTEIPLGVVSLTVRESQAQTEAMYLAFMGSSDYSIWDEEAEDGKTYGEQAVETALEDVELMYIMKTKAADYGVELTEEDEEAIAEAAAAFIEANTEETLEDLAVNEEQVKTFLELETYKERIYDPIIADVDTEVSDEEAQQSSFDYVSVSISDLEDDEIETKKEDLQKILDAQTEDPDAELNDTAQSVSEDYSAYSGTFDAYEEDTDEESEDSDDDSSSYSAYPDEVMEVLRTLDDGEVGPDVIETDSSLYVVQLDQKYDEDATESEKESIISERESELYSTTTEGWMDDAEIEVNEKVLKTLKVKDNHKYTITTPSPTPEPTSEASEEDSADTSETVSEETASEETVDTAAAISEAAEKETAEATEETAEEETAEATATPTAKATATPTAKATATPTAKATATPTAKVTATPTAKASK